MDIVKSRTVIIKPLNINDIQDLIITSLSKHKNIIAYKHLKHSGKYKVTCCTVQQKAIKSEYGEIMELLNLKLNLFAIEILRERRLI